METAKGLLSLFVLNTKLKISSSMMYRTDFILGLFIALGYSSVGPVFQYILFTQTKGYPGWNLNQIILFQGVLLIVTGVIGVLFGDIRNIAMELLYGGDFDRLLLKPYPPIGILLASSFTLRNAGSIFAGIALSVYSMIILGITLRISNLLLFLVFLLCSLVFYVALNILYCSVAIMIIRMWRVYDFFDKLYRFGQFPLEIYPSVVQAIFVTVFPFAVGVYYPTQALLGRLDLKALFSAFGSFLLLYLCLKLWNYCLKKYTSAGG